MQRFEPYNQCREVGNAAHDSLNHSPAKRSACFCRPSMDDGTNAMCPNDGPDKERDTCDWNKKGFDREEMADLVYGKPYGGKRANPE